MTYNLDTSLTSICPVPSRQGIKVPTQRLHVQKCPQAPWNPVLLSKGACHSSTHKYNMSIHSLVMEPPDSINLWHRPYIELITSRDYILLLHVIHQNPSLKGSIPTSHHHTWPWRRV